MRLQCHLARFAARYARTGAGGVAAYVTILGIAGRIVVGGTGADAGAADGLPAFGAAAAGVVIGIEASVVAAGGLTTFRLALVGLGIGCFAQVGGVGGFFAGSVHGLSVRLEVRERACLAIRADQQWR